MSTYSSNTFNSSSYNSFRPTYPPEFFNYVMEYHNPGEIKADLNQVHLDIGCGTGQAVIPLISNFKHTIASDPSEVMINIARERVLENQNQNQNSKELNSVEFLISPAEDLSAIKDSSVDLVTAAECVHWLDHDKFLGESYRVLKSGGTLAYWLYNESIFQGPESDVANKIYNKFIYQDERYMQTYWEQPGKSKFREFLSSCNAELKKQSKDSTEFQNDGQIIENISDNSSDNGLKFHNTKIQIFNQSNLSNLEIKSDIVENKGDFQKNHLNFKFLIISKKMTLDNFMNFIKTHSALHTWYVNNPNVIKGSSDDLVEIMRNEFILKCGWDNHKIIEIIWDSTCVFTKKI
ncbi:hypothetical protein B5S32_g317 [[Candida] boidinii]|nr:hypothetical protein B5S32_g317 [[Candida] boidinii]